MSSAGSVCGPFVPGTRSLSRKRIIMTEAARQATPTADTNANELVADEERSLLAIERRMRIVDVLNSRGTIAVAELTELLGASPATVRRDLSWLDEHGILTRTRGGAVAAGRVQDLMRHYDPTYGRRLAEYVEEKRAIGRRAAELVADGETIIIDAGSTTQYMIPNLHRKQDLIVITNSLAVVNELLAFSNTAPNLTVILTGGILRGRALSFVGMIAEYALSQFFVDKTFLGARGISIETGLTNPAIEEIPLKRQMIQAAKQVIVLADHSKFGQTYTGLIAPLNAAASIITDDGIDPALIPKITANGPNILLASREEG
jgi:DeoR family transcriptional regulator, fructose operon transcriptional repressor